ncbi:MAG: CRISPR-associated protein Cas4 [Theionarchaea archaeon]|nr:CRISPR-associated protein Cas4 [Theionarchaea archaeon]
MIHVTDLIKLRICPYRFYLEKIEKISLPPTQDMYVGTVFHKISEEIMTKEQFIFSTLNESYSPRQIFNILYKEYSRVIRNVILRRKKKLLSLGIDHEQLFASLREHYRTVAISRAVFMKRCLKTKEIEIEIETVEYYIEDPDLDLAGRVDRIEIHKGIPVPVEIKSVEKNYPTDIEILQLTGYALLMERERDMAIPTGIIEYPSKRFSIEISDELREMVLNLRDHALSILRGVTPEKVRTDRCDSCQFYKRCWKG